ncbi:hypothetical protein Bca4012_004762 [Brassica carinata]
MRSTAKMDETGIKVSGWNYKSVGEVERKQPGLLLATRKALDKLGFGCHKAVISCFDGFAVHVFRALN